MKRGLVPAVNDRQEIYEARLERLREQLRADGLGVALIYGDVYRSDDIAHLTNLCIYWHEGVIAVPVRGAPALLAKLSKRVHPWMQRTTILSDLRASQKLPELIAGYLDEIGAETVALVDLEWWPAQLVDDLLATGSIRDFVNWRDAVRRLRLVPDALDRADLECAGALVTAGLEAASSAGPDPRERLAALERATRGGGARDVLGSCTKIGAGDAEVQIDCTVQFANVWAHGNITTGDVTALHQELESVVAELRTGVRVADLKAAVKRATVSVINYCDLATGGDLRPFQDTEEALTDGTVVAVTVEINGARAGGTYVVQPDHARPLSDTSQVTKA